MKRVTLVPHGWPCSLDDCPPGPFTVPGSEPGTYMGFRSSYLDTVSTEGRTQRRVQAYTLTTGEAWWGGTTNHEDRGAMLVQPLAVEVEDDE